MKDEKCPFLETTTVKYCKAFPVKMIPADRASSQKGMCNSGVFPECALYKEKSGPSADVENVRGFLVQPDYYLHPRHLWVTIFDEEEHTARLGIDDFAQRLIGPIDRVSLPAEGTAVKENAVCFHLHSGKRTVKMVSPVDGVVRKVHRHLVSNPSLINSDPYREGWIFSLRIAGEGLKGLFYGNSAKRWLHWEVERLQRAFSSELGITATDGGETLADISGHLSDAQWNRVVNLFIG